MLRALILASALVHLQPAQAARRGSCEPLKPEQRLSEEQQKVVDAAIRGGVTGMGRGSGELSTSAESRVELRVLSEDDLARSWFLYQTCVMKETGLIDESTAQELVRSLMGLEPEGRPLAILSDRVMASAVGDTAIRISGQPVTAHVYIDGRPRGQLGDGMTVPVSPGPHEVELKLPGYKTIRAELDVQAGTEETVELEGFDRRISTVEWIGIGIGVGAVIGTGTLIGAIAVKTLQ